jgi:hypothetical protein
MFMFEQAKGLVWARAVFHREAIVGTAHTLALRNAQRMLEFTSSGGAIV